MPGRRDGQFSELGQEIDKYLQTRGFLTPSREGLIPLVWAEVVGEWYCKHTRVLRVTDGVVTVRCDSPSRAQQLQLDSARIAKALNARVGGYAVREIRPSSAGIRRRNETADATSVDAPSTPSAGDLRRMNLEPDEQRWVRKTVAVISDEELRRRVEAVLSKHCKAQRWLRAHGYTPCERCEALVPAGARLCKACDPGRIPSQGSPDVLDNPWREGTWRW